ncbi:MULTISPECIES: hypothetical protein [Collimonas]|nr:MULTISPECIES: hypothetical protein [Collimonas]AMP02084.1 hypothetical protein CAter10_4694 [Collimonas arenae]AMP17232.1 hypothetical protein CPter291_5019 [Collimonas pratensis]
MKLKAVLVICMIIGSVVLNSRANALPVQTSTSIRGNGSTHIACGPEVEKGSCGPWKFTGKPSAVVTAGMFKAHHILRIGADQNNVYVGVNARWRVPMAGEMQNSGDQGNPLLVCRAQDAACSFVKMYDSTRVSHIIGISGLNLLAEIESYKSDSLNRFDVSYERSFDSGQTWIPVKVPVNCNQHRSCRLVFLDANRYTLLATDTSAPSFDNWTTQIYETEDSGMSWIMRTDGAGLSGSHWDAYVGDRTVSITLGAREHQKAILTIANNRDELALEDMKQLHGDVVKLIGNHDFLYAQVDSGTAENPEARLYAIAGHSANELWKSESNVSDALATHDLLLIRTWDHRDFVLPAGEFRSTLHISKDRGATWMTYPMPDDLIDSLIAVVNSRIWVVTQKAVYYLDVR